jgi:hypothetical protein
MYASSVSGVNLSIHVRCGRDVGGVSSSMLTAVCNGSSGSGC